MEDRKKPPGFTRSEIDVTHIKGSGPGGQNRNKRMSGVRVVHEPTGIKVEATERRSQAQNLKHAMERLSERLEKKRARKKPRFKTKKTRGAQERRLKQKSQRSGIKQSRGRVRGDD